MEGKIVVVTGASGALGKVVAASALAKGARVAGMDHAASHDRRRRPTGSNSAAST